jgi:PAS domain S-box-containing protein
MVQDERTKEDLLLEIEALNTRLVDKQNQINESKFRNIFNGINDAVFVHTIVKDGFGSFIEVNDIACDRYGYTREEFLKMRANDLSCPGDEGIWTTANLEEISKKGKITLETFHKTKKGLNLTVEVNSSIIELNDQTCLLCVVRDITARKGAEQIVWEKNARIAALLNALPDIMFIFDSEGTYLEIYTNDEARLIVPSEQLLGKKISDFLSKEFTDTFVGYIKSAINTQKLQVYEYELELEDGIHYFEARIGPYTQDKVLSIARDITDRKKGEIERLITKERYREIVEKAGAAVIVDDLEGNFLYANDKFCDLFGIAPEELTSGSIKNTVHPDEVDRILKIHRDRIKGKDVPEKYEFKGIKKDGSTIYLEVNAVLLKEQGKVTGTRSYIWDVTHLKEFEMKLSESETLLRQIIDTAPNCIFVKNREGKYLVVNKQMADLHRTTPEDLVGKYDYQIAESWFKSREYKEFRQSELNAITDKHILIIDEERFTYKDGRELWFHTTKIPFTFEDDENCLLVISTDITESIISRAILKDSEEKYRSLTENLNVGVYRTTPGVKGEFINVNKAFVEIFGYSAKEEILKMNVSDLYVDPEDRKRLNKEILKNEKLINWETSLKKKDGTSIYCSITVTAIKEKNKIIYFDGIVENITERYKAEKALKESEKKFSSIVESSPMGMHIYALEEDGRLVFIGANPAAAKILGVETDQYIGKTIEEAFPPLAETEIPDVYRKVALTGERWQTQQVLYEDDQISGAYEVYAFQTSPGKMVALFLDITERKLMIEALKSSEERLKILFEFAPDAYYLTNPEGIFLDANKAAEDLLGINKEKAIGKSFGKLNLLPPKDFLKASRLMLKLSRGRSVEGEEFQLKHKNGTLIPVEVNAYPMKIKNETVVLGIARNISERKRAEELLQESEEKHRKLIETTSEGFWLINHERINIDVNQSLCDILGYSRDEMIGKTPSDFVDKVNNEIFTKQILLSQRTKHRTYEISLKRKDGTNVPTLFSATSIFDKKGKPSGSFAFVTDITEKKKAEINLSKSEKKYRDLFEKSKDAILIIHNRKFVDCNEATINMLRYQTKDEFLDTHPSELSPEIQPDGKKSFIKANQMMDTAINNGSHRFEWLHKRSNGDIFPVEVLLTTISVEEKNQIIHTVWRDITERKQAEEQIRKDLKEKDTLLKELYHRTKNNMQIISAMLSMQARKSESNYVAQSFREIINKINAMSLVHEKLYHSKDLNRINLKEYLQDLIKLLLNSFNHQEGKITTRFVLADVFLTIETANPLGIVINELVTNIFKHGFKDQDECIITIDLEQDSTGTINLMIADNGAGIPEGTDLRKIGSMGLQTVFSLIEYQIKGKISYENDQGLKWHIQLKENISSQRT